jgi:uncharacterized protein YkwD
MIKTPKSPKIKIGRPLQITAPTPQRQPKMTIRRNQIPSLRPHTRSISLKTNALTQAEEDIFSTSNAIRADYGKPPLLGDERLSELARDYSRLMLENHFFSHMTPDGKTLSDRFVEAHLRYRAIAENIAFYEGVFFTIPTHEVVANWLHSPGHRANLLDEKGIGFTHLGIGIAMGKSPSASGQVYFYTQLFWLPDA